MASEVRTNRTGNSINLNESLKKIDSRQENKEIAGNTVDPLIFESLSSSSSDGKSGVLLLIDENIAKQELENSIKTFVDDIKNESHRVIVKISKFSSPEEVREYLQRQYATLNPKLEGVILIGKIPYAHLVIDDTNIPGGSVRSAPTYEFYQDLNGAFSKDNPDFPDAYSSHDGETDSELWVTTLPWYKDQNFTIKKLNFYFNKNHIYRTVKTQTKGFIEIQELLNANNRDEYDQFVNLSLKSTGTYASLPANHSFKTVDYFLDNLIRKPDLSAGYANLSIENRYGILNLVAHGTEDAAGQLTKNWLDENILAPTILLISGCNSGNLDAITAPILVETIYNSNSRAVFAQGTSTFSGGLGKNADGFYVSNILRELFNGKNVGQAFLKHLNTPLIYPWNNNIELHRGILILVGDGTLKLQL